MPLAAFDPSPLPFVLLMGLGFLVGVGGHIWRSRLAVASGILLVLLATVLLPVGLYLAGEWR